MEEGADIGYLNKGGGKPKTLDPLKAPLVRRLFELYAAGRHTLNSLLEESRYLGLRNWNGSYLSRNGLSVLLNNPFYMGLIRVRRNSQMYPGVHQPLISKSLFDQVQDILRGKTNTKIQKHEFLFRRMLECKYCGYSLTGEIQKGHAYYRCHTRTCPPTCIREEEIESEARRVLEPLRLDEKDKESIKAVALKFRQEWADKRETEIQALQLQVNQIKERLDRLTDALVDRLIEAQTFEKRKATLLLRQKDLEEKIEDIQTGKVSLPDRVDEFFELIKAAPDLYNLAIPEEKRNLLKKTTSNRVAEGKNVAMTRKNEVELIAKRSNLSHCGQGGIRTPVA